MLKVGTKAPDFALPDQNGTIHHLKDYLGHKIVLYFYPKDNTSGCTKQACSFRDHHDEFQQQDAIVIGISKDSQKSHHNFIQKNELPFLLLSDTDIKAIQDYDVWKEKSMYGRKYMGVVRTTYLIDEKGIIIQAFEKVKPAENAEQMLDEIKK